MKSTTDWVIVGLLAVAAVFLFTNLDSGLLWQDEAETAVLSRNALRFGYPRAFDGHNGVDIEPAIGYGPGDAWVYSPWLPFYLLAGVFAVIGESTWAARLPFAMFGLLSVWFTWRLACRLTSNQRIQRLSVALLVCSVPFLLHMRQCRYYSLTTALLLAICLTYLNFLRQPTRGRALWLGLIVALFFHTNFGVVLPVAGSILIHQIGWGTRMTRRRLLSAGALCAALTVPWALVFYRPGSFAGVMTLERLTDHVEYYVRITNKYLMPLAAIAVSAVIWRLWRRKRLPASRERPLSPSIQWFLALVVGLWAVFLLLPDQRHMRYLIPLVPLMAVGTAWWLTAWTKHSRLIGWSLMAAALFTNVLQSSHLKIPLADFTYELTHRYRGPMEGVVAYLREHSQPGETIKIPYDDRTVMFYTQLAVERPSLFLKESFPEWIVIRHDWIPREFFQSEHFRRIEATYERIELDAPDIQWQNREDPGSHHFRTVHDAPRIVIYRRREAT